MKSSKVRIVSIFITTVMSELMTVKEFSYLLSGTLVTLGFLEVYKNPINMYGFFHLV